VRENKRIRKRISFSQFLWYPAGGQETHLDTHTDPSTSKVILSHKGLEAIKEARVLTTFLKIFRGLLESLPIEGIIFLKFPKGGKCPRVF